MEKKLNQDLMELIINYQLPKRDAFKKHILGLEINKLADLSRGINDQLISFKVINERKRDGFKRNPKQCNGEKFYDILKNNLASKIFFYYEMMPIISKLTDCDTNIFKWDEPILTVDEPFKPYIYGEQNKEIYHKNGYFSGLYCIYLEHYLRNKKHA